MKWIAAVVLALLLLAYPVAYWASAREITCTVTEKDRSTDGEGGSKYRIYTKQCDVLSNEDSLLQLKFNSASVQGQVEVGHTYVFDVNGWRFGLFSWFPNVDTVVREVK